MKMTKQRFYEMCILKTFQYAEHDVYSPFYKIAKDISLDIDETFDTLMLKCASKGYGKLFPEKEQFTSLGWKYVIQIIDFVFHNINDDELVFALCEFLGNYPDVLDYSDDEEDLLMYSFIVDNVMDTNARALLASLVDSYLLRSKNAANKKNILSIAKAFGMTNLQLEEINQISERVYEQLH